MLLVDNSYLQYKQWMKTMSKRPPAHITVLSGYPGCTMYVRQDNLCQQDSTSMARATSLPCYGLVYHNHR